jgi:hypothetical protein
MPDTSNSNYPRSHPYRAPAEGSRPRSLLLALGALVLVAATAGTTILLLNLFAQPSQADTAPEKGRQAEGKPQRDKPSPRPAAHLGKKTREQFLAALGSLSAAHVYQSYLNIGLLADGVESEAYTKAQAEEMLATVGAMIGMVDRQLDKIREMDLEGDDKDNIEEVQAIVELLRRQARALRAYWATGESEQAGRYQKAREACWASISRLLEID